MFESSFWNRLVFITILLWFVVCIPPVTAGAQTLPPPGNDCGCPQQNSDAVSLSSGMFAPFLPSIPNLQLGYQYTFGKYVRTGRFTADYVLPFQLNSKSVLFGEAHAEGWDFWKKKKIEGYDTANNRLDLSFGGGYRVMPTENTFFGANAFYDTTRLFGTWYSSGGVGLELASKIVGDDAVDLNFNWYGNLFSKDALVNAFRNKGGSFDIEAGYSHALFNQALDLRLKFAGYQFDAGSPVYGWRTGAELTTRDGVFTAKYEHGSDRFAGPYNTIGGYVNIGFSLENILRGESPFSKPEPVFGSPRRLARSFSRPVRRTWQATSSGVYSRHPAGQPWCPNLSGYVFKLDGHEAVDKDLALQPPWPQGDMIRGDACWCNLSYTGRGIYGYGVVVIQACNTSGSECEYIIIAEPTRPNECQGVYNFSGLNAEMVRLVLQLGGPDDVVVGGPGGVSFQRAYP